MSFAHRETLDALNSGSDEIWEERVNSFLALRKALEGKGEEELRVENRKQGEKGGKDSPSGDENVKLDAPRREVSESPKLAVPHGEVKDVIERSLCRSQRMPRLALLARDQEWYCGSLIGETLDL